LICSTETGCSEHDNSATETPVCEFPIAMALAGTTSPRYVAPKQLGSGAENWTAVTPTPPGRTTT
jgi:hypothetical protein